VTNLSHLRQTIQQKTQKKDVKTPKRKYPELWDLFKSTDVPKRTKRKLCESIVYDNTFSVERHFESKHADSYTKLLPHLEKRRKLSRNH
jgi:hypothetical protein